MSAGSLVPGASFCPSACLGVVSPPVPRAAEDAFYQQLVPVPRLHPTAPPGSAFEELLRSHEARDWLAYAKPPFGGPQRALEYLAVTPRIAISNRRLLSLEEDQVTFQWKDHRSEHREKSKVMTVDADEFQRRLLIHVLPGGFQRIRYYGYLANCHERKTGLLSHDPDSRNHGLAAKPEQCRQMQEATTRAGADTGAHAAATASWSDRRDRADPLASIATGYA